MGEVGSDSVAGGGVEGAASSPSDGVIAWEYDIPLLTNRFILYEFVKVTAISVGLMYVVLGVMGLFVDGELFILPWQIALVTFATVLVLFAVAALVMGNRHHALFVVAPKGVGYEAGEREKALTRATAGVGAAVGSATTSGAAMAAAARDSLYTPWDDVHRVVVHEGQRVISLKNSWRVVLRLYVPEELWDRVVSAVEEYNAETPATPGRTASVAWPYRVSWVVISVALTMGAQAWAWNDLAVAGRIGVFGGLMVMLAGVSEGPVRRILGLTGGVAMLAHGGSLVYSALQPAWGLWTVSYAGSQDTALLVLALVCTIGLVGMGFARAYGGASDREARS